MCKKKKVGTENSNSIPFIVCPQGDKGDRGMKGFQGDKGMKVSWKKTFRSYQDLNKNSSKEWKSTEWLPWIPRNTFKTNNALTVDILQ